MNIFKKLLYWELILLCLESFGNSVRLLLVEESQELFLEITSENFEINPTPEPFPVSFEIDMAGQEASYWHHSQAFTDPVRRNWFSYFASWKAADIFHLTEYFRDHGINADLLKNEELGFWTSFSEILCLPGSTTTTTPPTTTSPTNTTDSTTTTTTTTATTTTITTTTTPIPECYDESDDPYPHFTLEFQDPDRYILEQLEITCVMDEDSSVVVHIMHQDTNATTNTLIFQSLKWEHHIYNFSSMNNYDKIKVELKTSDIWESGQFIIIDKILVRALDTFGAPTTTTTTVTVTDKEPTSSTSTTKLTPETESSQGLTSTSTLSTTVPGENSAHVSLTTPVFVSVLCLSIMFL